MEGIAEFRFVLVVYYDSFIQLVFPVSKFTSVLVFTESICNEVLAHLGLVLHLFTWSTALAHVVEFSAVLLLLLLGISQNNFGLNTSIALIYLNSPRVYTLNTFPTSYFPHPKVLLSFRVLLFSGHVTHISSRVSVY